MSHVSQWPMKMPERRSLQGGKLKKLGHQGMGTNEQQEKWVRVEQQEKWVRVGHGCQGKKILSKMSWRPTAVSMVLFESGLIIDITYLRR